MTIRKMYQSSEIDPRAELRRWQIINQVGDKGTVLACVYLDVLGVHDDGHHIILRDATIRDYRDHYVILHGRYFYRMNKKDEHKP